MKYIVVTGGVVSGLGKGVTISSIGRMLKNCGIRTTSIKIDPYLVSANGRKVVGCLGEGGGGQYLLTAMLPACGAI